jgi:zinc/manganese transport system substrate-binding protein/manganese/iron transport system substrate-binding protein
VEPRDGGFGRFVVVLALAAIGVGACQATPGSSDGRISVVTSTTVFADMVQQVGGDLVSVTSLVPKNGDVHTFEPRPSDMRSVARARLVVMNGLGLDDWLLKTLASAAQPGTPLLKLGENLPGVSLLPGDEPGTENPHLWMDVTYAERYADRIAEALTSIDPGHAATYRARNRAYQGALRTLDGWVREQIGTIPEVNRRLVTFHDAFPYYAREYGIAIVGVAVQAPGQAPSAGYTARLIEAIRAAGVKAIFSEAAFPTRLVDQLAAETGARVVANLYDGSLGDPPVTSYEALIRWDTQQLVEALR